MEILGKYAVEMSEFFFEEGLVNENGIGQFASFNTGVRTDDDVHVIKSAGYEMGVSQTNCAPIYKNISPFKSKKWTINPLELNIEVCENSWKGEMLRGTAPLSYDSKEMMDAVNKIVVDALAKNQLLNAFFGDKGNAGQTNNALKCNKGWFALADAIVTADSNRRTTISTNTKAALRTGMTAVNVLDDLCDDASNKLAGSEMQIIVNRTLWSAVCHNLRTQAGTHVETAYEELFMGIKKTTWNGVPVFILPALDEIQGACSTAPHASDAGLALATTKQNMVVGMREKDNLGDVTVIVDKKDKKLYIPSNYSIGTLFVDDDLVQFAY